jgi:hypothetical protein
VAQALVHAAVQRHAAGQAEVLRVAAGEARRRESAMHRLFQGELGRWPRGRCARRESGVVALAGEVAEGLEDAAVVDAVVVVRCAPTGSALTS